MANINLNNLQGIPFGIDSGRPSGPQPGQPYFNGQSNRLEIYTQTVGWQNIVQETPSVVNIVGVYKESLSSNTLTVNGTNFAVGCIAYAVGTNGVETQATTTTLVSVVQLSATFTGLSKLYEPYDIKVVNPSNLYGVLYDCLPIDETPIWITSAGSLGTFTEFSPVSLVVAANDPESVALTYSISSGSLPGGLSINSATGAISGTPSDVIPNTTFNFTINASDGQNNSYRNFSITINDRGPSWSTAQTLPTFTKNVSYSTTLVATDDNGIASYTLFSGSLPTGLSLNGTTGVISGTPTSTTTAVFTVRATDNGGNYIDRQFTIPNVGPTWSTVSPLTTFTRNSPYSATLVATDDGTISSYSIVSGTLPTGLSLDSSTGVISGTPTSSATSTIVVRATDNNGSTIDRSFDIPNIGPVWTTSGTITGIANGVAYSYQLVATDDSGVAPTYSLVSGTLPTGISVSSSGLISGTTSGITSSTGNLSITFRATDANGTFSNQTLIIPTLLFSFTSNTFTSGSSTVGRFGDALSTFQSAYSGQSWASNTSYLNLYNSRNGYQLFTIPSSGVYEITVKGARAGTSTGPVVGIVPGRGAVIRSRFSLTGGQYLVIVCGKIADEGGTSTSHAGGGGATWVMLSSNGTTITNPLIIAGGGGGNYSTAVSQAALDAALSQYPRNYGLQTDTTYWTFPGLGQGGKTWDAGGGGGYLSGGNNSGQIGTGSGVTGTSGANSPIGTYGRGFDQSGEFLYGGSTNQTTTVYGLGGFGGGGGGHTGANGGGGGGGYSGGAGGGGTGNAQNSGFGGGSYIHSSATAVATSDGTWEGLTTFNGSAISNLSLWNDTAGTVLITKI